MNSFWVNAIRHMKDALDHAEQTCRYHGDRFETSGMLHGLPRCDSCKQPFRVRKALDALDLATGRPRKEGGS